jgi:hypothetical protein
MANGWVAVNRSAGMPETEAAFSDHPEIETMKGPETHFGVAVRGVYCTRHMLHSVLTHDDGMGR